MENLKQSPARLRKRKMLLVLPVLVLPFITLAFWSMGGGKGGTNDDQQVKIAQGLNLQLPDARFKDDKAMNKMSYYDKAAYDSAKREELLRNDPFYKIKTFAVDSAGHNEADSSEQRIYRKLAELDRAMNTKNDVYPDPNIYSAKDKMYRSSETKTRDAGALQQMIGSAEKDSPAPDPQMNQLNDMLDKIMDIQHPERVNDQLKTISLKQGEKVFPVRSTQDRNNITLLVSETGTRSKLYTVTDTGFYSIDDHVSEEAGTPNAIQAVVHETRRIVNGSIIKLRLLTDVFINGNLIPNGNFVYGKATINGERLTIEVPSVRYNGSIYPVSLVVYDMDGLDGVFVPGAITRDVAKESTDRAIQGIALGSLDPSVGAQAASAGIEAAKALLTKKVKLVRVTLKAGYKVLLKDKKWSS